MSNIYLLAVSRYLFCCLDSRQENERQQRFTFRLSDATQAPCSVRYGMTKVNTGKIRLKTQQYILGARAFDDGTGTCSA